MTIEEAQNRVDTWITTTGVRYFNELTNLGILMEEVGELSRLMVRKYGEQSFKESDKGKEQLKNIDDNGLVSFFKGLKDGTLKSTNGVFISENEFVLGNVKIYSFRFSFKLKGKEKLVENYAFIYKDSTYTIQFMADKDKFENNNEFRQSIIDSIKFN